MPPAFLRGEETDASALTLSSASSSALARLASGAAMAVLILLEWIRFGGLVPSVGNKIEIVFIYFIFFFFLFFFFFFFF